MKMSKQMNVFPQLLLFELKLKVVIAINVMIYLRGLKSGVTIGRPIVSMKVCKCDTNDQS